MTETLVRIPTAAMLENAAVLRWSAMMATAVQKMCAERTVRVQVLISVEELHATTESPAMVTESVRKENVSRATRRHVHARVMLTVWPLTMMTCVTERLCVRRMVNV